MLYNTKYTAIFVAECKMQADICFIIDSSSSITLSDWSIVKTFIKEVVSRFNVSSEGVRFGLVLYSTTAYVKLKLNEVYTTDGISKRIDSLPYLDGHTNTAGGLYLANHVIFKAVNGDRPGVKNIGILLTDGASNIDTDKTEPYAKEAKRNGVKMIAIGVSNKVARKELKAIASQPHKYTIFHLSKFEALSHALDTVVGEACYEKGTRTHLGWPTGKTII